MKIKTWNIEQMTGYKPITTFYEDFSIADHFGISAIKDTFKRALKGWKRDYEYMTEFVMALNWKIWEHYDNNKIIAKEYNELYEQAYAYCVNHFKGEELQYFYRTIN